MKEKITKDIGDTVVLADVFDSSQTMEGVVTEIIISNKGIMYKGIFNTCIAQNEQYSFWQDDIIE